jgi:hypothetical protein
MQAGTPICIESHTYLQPVEADHRFSAGVKHFKKPVYSRSF